MEENKGMIFAITGPSSSGKTTYSRELVEHYSDTANSSIVYTTRKQRPGEQEGIQYHFVNDSQFNTLLQNNIFACSKNFCGNRYGIEKEYIKSVIEEEGKDLIFDTIFDIPDLMAIGENVTIIFLTTAPEELKRRIIERDPNINPEELNLRMEDIRIQMQNATSCDYIVSTDSNRSQEEVLQELIGIVEQVRSDLK